MYCKQFIIISILQVSYCRYCIVSVHCNCVLRQVVYCSSLLQLTYLQVWNCNIVLAEFRKKTNYKKKIIFSIQIHKLKTVQIPVSSRFTINEGVCPIWTLITSRAYVTSDTIKRHGCGSPANTVPPRTANSIRCCQTFPCA